MIYIYYDLNNNIILSRTFSQKHKSYIYEFAELKYVQKQSVDALISLKIIYLVYLHKYMFEDQTIVKDALLKLKFICHVICQHYNCHKM